MRNVNVTAVMAALVAFGAVACSSTTMIYSTAPNTKVYLNGEYVGTAPYAMTDTKIVGSTTHVRLEAPGYQPFATVISRNEEFSVGACIGGVLVLVPFLWIMDYKAQHSYELRPLQAPPPPPPSPPPGA
jgi:PEGA domain-containing protein